MNQYELGLFAAFVAFYVPAFATYHFMVFRVNQQLPSSRRIPHSLSLGQWNRLATEYKGFYPRSILYRVTISYAVTVLIIAVVLLILRFWEYARGR